MDAGSSQILITRPSGKYRYSMRRYRIKVDGDDAGSIRPGTELAIPTSAGTHVVQARIDWTGSPKVSVTVNDGAVVRLVVQPAGSAATALFQLLSGTRYLKLERAGNP